MVHFLSSDGLDLKHFTPVAITIITIYNNNSYNTKNTNNNYKNNNTTIISLAEINKKLTT